PQEVVMVFVMEISSPSVSTTVWWVVFAALLGSGGPIWGTCVGALSKAALESASVNSSTGTFTNAGSPSTVIVVSNATDQPWPIDSMNSADPGSASARPPASATCSIWISDTPGSGGAGPSIS